MTYGVHDHKIGWLFLVFMTAIFGLMIFMAGCKVEIDSQPTQVEQVPPPPPTHTWDRLIGFYVPNTQAIIEVVRIDNCQYIVVMDHLVDAIALIHKSDCPNHAVNGNVLRSANE